MSLVFLDLPGQRSTSLFPSTLPEHSRTIRTLHHPHLVPRRVSRNPRRSCPTPWRNHLQPLTAPSPVSSLLDSFDFPISPTCLHVPRAPTLLLFSAPPALSTPGKSAAGILQSDFLHAQLAFHQSSHHSLFLTQILNFFIEVPAFPPQNNKHSQMLLPSRFTGD